MRKFNSRLLHNVRFGPVHRHRIDVQTGEDRHIAKARELDVDTILNNIYVAKIYNASHLELIIRAIGNLIQQNKIKLVIVDSIISLHRASFWAEGICRRGSRS